MLIIDTTSRGDLEGTGGILKVLRRNGKTYGSLTARGDGVPMSRKNQARAKNICYASEVEPLRSGIIEAAKRLHAVR
jgi:hypothetical protein